MILPYLHERRIYLNRKKSNTNYFYTSIDTSISEEAQYNDRIKDSLQNKHFKNK